MEDYHDYDVSPPPTYQASTTCQPHDLTTSNGTSRSLFLQKRDTANQSCPTTTAAEQSAVPPPDYQYPFEGQSPAEQNAFWAGMTTRLTDFRSAHEAFCAAPFDIENVSSNIQWNEANDTMSEVELALSDILASPAATRVTPAQLDDFTSRILGTGPETQAIRYRLNTMWPPRRSYIYPALQP